MKTTKKIALGGATLLTLGAVFTFPPTNQPTTSAIGIIVDMPQSDPGSLYSRMQLLTGGGVHKRDIYVQVTATTHTDNLAVIWSNPNVVKISTSTPALLETNIKKDMKDQNARYIRAKEL